MDGLTSVQLQLRALAAADAPISEHVLHVLQIGSISIAALAAIAAAFIALHMWRP